MTLTCIISATIAAHNFSRYDASRGAILNFKIHFYQTVFIMPFGRVALLAGVLFLSGCAPEKYVAKPIEPIAVSQKLLAKDPLSREFHDFCKSQGYQGHLPFTTWGIDELTLSALFHHTKLDVAKAQLGVAKASIQSAGLKPAPLLGGTVARSNQANNDIRPFSYGLNVEIPIETANKRTIRIEEAQQLAEVARLDVAETAWNLRSQLVSDWLDYHENMALAKLQQDRLVQEEKLVNLMKKRVQTGLAGNSDIAPLLSQMTKTASLLAQTQSQQASLISQMAADAGLSVDKFNQIPIGNLEMDITLHHLKMILVDPAKAAAIQSDALLNRIDIRRGLARYAAAESKIKLEVAKQTPDISISPGFLFEYGDKIWSLGFASLLNLLVNQDPALIREAEQLRNVEGAQFEALQANVIAKVAQAFALLRAAQAHQEQANFQKQIQTNALQKAQKQFDAGLLDRLELSQESLLNTQFLEEISRANFAVLRAGKQFEDVMQRPISNSDTFTQEK